MKDIIKRKLPQKVQERFKLSDNTITNDKRVVAENFNDIFVNISNNFADVFLLLKLYHVDTWAMLYSNRFFQIQWPPQKLLNW